MPETSSESATLLDRAELAQRSGHFAQVRALLAELATRGALAAEEEKRAQALRERLRPDPMVAPLILACLILFAIAAAANWH